jgi:hypothetical protein
MKGTGAGWDSLIYRGYIVGGLLGIVAIAVATAVLFDPQGRTMLPVYTGGGCATIYLLGFLAYWWAQFLFAGYGDMRHIPEGEGGGAPGISALRSWTTLFEAMALWGGNPEALLAERRRTRQPMLEWFAWATALALFPLVGVWLYLFGVLSQETFLTYIRPAIVILAVLMLVRTYFLLGSVRRDDQEAIYTPLNLSQVDEPQPDAALKVLEGVRHGRPVRITVNGSHCITQVSGSVPEFEVQALGGKFVLAEDLPEQVYAALKSLRKAKRWVGVKLVGTAEGMAVERRARGVNLWLYDLWLAERLLEQSQLV